MSDDTPSSPAEELPSSEPTEFRSEESASDTPAENLEGAAPQDGVSDGAVFPSMDTSQAESGKTMEADPLASLDAVMQGADHPAEETPAAASLAGKEAQTADGGPAEATEQGNTLLPSELVVYPLGGRPFFPGMLTPIQVEGSPYYDTIKMALDSPGKMFGIVLSHAEDGDEVFTADKLYRFGTVTRIMESVVHEQDKQIKLLAEGLSRFEIIGIADDGPPILAIVKHHDKPVAQFDPDTLKPYMLAVISTLKEILKYDSLYQEQVKMFLSRHNFSEPDRLADFVASMTSSNREELQEVLETLNIRDRLEKVLGLLKKELEIVKLQDKISKQVEEGISENQRQFFLREQLKEIQKELGITKDDRTADLDKFRDRLKQLTLSEEASNKLNDEMEKLAILETGSSEYNVTRNYVDWLTSLPWGVHSKDRLNITRARRVLDEDHDELKDVKERILEFLAVGKLKGKIGGSIILLVGPPGVGKTSVGRSIARAVGREFFRFSVGGMRDEAEIKGHRRTYVGAMPGKVIQALRYTKVANPIFMLDEVDKIGASYHGDPASALLEVLDPEQNTEFLDHYLDVRFDLSKVLFICTANQTDTIPLALLDRMEIIRLSGYITSEKMTIARNHLVPKQLEKNGLSGAKLRFSRRAIRTMIEGYAREAGVRHLEQKIGAVSRKAALQILEKKASTPIRIDHDNVEKFLGKPSFRDEPPISGVGIVTGLAWTAMGGATLDVESAQISTSKADFILTGNMGDVMKESARIAYSYLQGQCKALGGQSKILAEGSIHIHVPEGATPKDGPSAGITLATSLLSLARNEPIPRRLAMTGEITLTGHVLPVGGIREKVIAARRVGIREIILPEACRKDYEEVPDHIRAGFVTHFVKLYPEVAKLVFG
ncbi:MAG: endopeptidase La [Magnetococcales bacterium]|nr:endopeptidase La [Magnetococcales bacterium]MBF0114358.1 endopeptidase La [Magnetococcales bacterium]